EAAAGLTPGAGGLYHHFGSKEDVLAFGVRRHLQRLEALRDVRRVIGDLGDLRAELAVTARYFLAELDSQTALLRIVATEARPRPDLLTEPGEILSTSTVLRFNERHREAPSKQRDKDRDSTTDS